MRTIDWSGNGGAVHCQGRRRLAPFRSIRRWAEEKDNPEYYRGVMFYPGQRLLSDFEVAILASLGVANVARLRILSREYTCVGGYVTFDNSSVDMATGLGDQQIGLNGTILLPKVPSGMGAVLFCNQGKPSLLEMFTYGDELWDGDFLGFSIAQNA